MQEMEPKPKWGNLKMKKCVRESADTNSWIFWVYHKSDAKNVWKSIFWKYGKTKMTLVFVIFYFDEQFSI